jgi:hypothetical protein
MKMNRMKKMSRDMAVAALVLLAAACANQPDVDEIAVGQDVALVKADGGLVEGTVASRDDKNVQVKTGQTTKSIPKDEIVDVRLVANDGDNAKPAEPPPAAKFREYTVPAGTTLSLRLRTPIDSGVNRVEDPVEASLAGPVSIGSAEVLPAGSIVKGTVSAVQASPKVKGVASITLHFESVAAAGRDDRYDIDAAYSETAEATRGADATKIGVGAGAGAVIGGLIGGKGGAAKGAAIGGGAGTTAVLVTTGKEVAHPVGTTLSVRLKRDVDVRVPIR